MVFPLRAGERKRLTAALGKAAVLGKQLQPDPDDLMLQHTERMQIKDNYIAPQKFRLISRQGRWKEYKNGLQCNFLAFYGFLTHTHWCCEGAPSSVSRRPMQS